MLPTFPKAKKAMNDVFANEIFRAMWSVCPVLREIRVRPQTEGKAASYEREDGKVVETQYKLHRVERSWKFEDAQGLSPEDFLKTAADLGEEMGSQMMGVRERYHIGGPRWAVSCFPNQRRRYRSE